MPDEAYELCFDRDAGYEARRLLRRYLHARGAPPTLEQDAVIVLGELVTNALDHGSALRGGPAGGPGVVRVAWTLEGQHLIIEVTDGGGTTIPRVVAAGPWDGRGRGIAMVDQISTGWRAETGNGTWVCADVPVVRRAGGAAGQAGRSSSGEGSVPSGSV